jgi:DNA processing protein
MEDERFYWIALKSIKGIGSVLYKRLLEQLGPPEAVFSAPRKKLFRIEGLSENSIEEILHFKGKEAVIREMTLMDAFPVSLIHYFHPHYPLQLKNIHDPPPFLYVMGEIWKQDARSIAVVGTRRPTPYGKQVAMWSWPVGWHGAS